MTENFDNSNYVTMTSNGITVRVPPQDVAYYKGAGYAVVNSNIPAPKKATKVSQAETPADKGSENG